MNINKVSEFNGVVITKYGQIDKMTYEKLKTMKAEDTIISLLNQFGDSEDVGKTFGLGSSVCMIKDTELYEVYRSVQTRGDKESVCYYLVVSLIDDECAYCWTIYETINDNNDSDGDDNIVG